MSNDLDCFFPLYNAVVSSSIFLSINIPVRFTLFLANSVYYFHLLLKLMASPSIPYRAKQKVNFHSLMIKGRPKILTGNKYHGIFIRLEIKSTISIVYLIIISRPIFFSSLFQCFWTISRLHRKTKILL